MIIKSRSLKVIKMYKICIVTATRAEYGILHPLIKRFLSHEDLEVQIVVTGTHLIQEFGYTYTEIQDNEIPIYTTISIVEPGDDPLSISKTISNALTKFAIYFSIENPDMVILLGDRTELMGISVAAVIAHIPIAHLHGGELTKGAVDDSMRHAITKMSYLHFASTEEYRKRIIQMGEPPEHVFNVGALGVENVLNEELFSEEEVREELGIPEGCPYVVATFHPVTLEEGTEIEQVQEMFYAIEQRNQLFYIITKANADVGGRRINSFMEEEVKKYPNVKLVSSLGMKRYLSAVKYSKFVLGNSSSGIIEVPTLCVPTVNIGDRQQGRIMSKSVIQCEPVCDSIVEAIDKALEMEQVTLEQNIYGTGESSIKVVEIIREFLEHKKIDLKKDFYDLW